MAAATTAGAAVEELAAGQRVAACVAVAGEVTGWVAAAVVVVVAAMGVGPLAARVVAGGVEVATAMVVEAATALEAAVERAAAKRVEVMGTRGRRVARNRLESPWMTCQAELTFGSRRRARSG